MKQLSYKTLKESGYTGYVLESAPEKVLQFGEGNFLRAFTNYWFDVSNEKAGFNGKCVLVQPIAAGLADLINAQEGLYTLYLRGSENGQRIDRKRVISSVSRCLNPYTEEGFAAMMQVAESDDLQYVVSNTTEAGIVYDPACIHREDHRDVHDGHADHAVSSSSCTGLQSAPAAVSCHIPRAWPYVPSSWPSAHQSAQDALYPLAAWHQTLHQPWEDGRHPCEDLSDSPCTPRSRLPPWWSALLSG